MATYILRDLPEDLWARVKSRIAKEERHLRPTLLQAMEHYERFGFVPARLRQADGRELVIAVSRGVTELAYQRPEGTRRFALTSEVDQDGVPVYEEAIHPGAWRAVSDAQVEGAHEWHQVRGPVSADGTATSLCGLQVRPVDAGAAIPGPAFVRCDLCARHL